MRREGLHSEGRFLQFARVGYALLLLLPALSLAAPAPPIAPTRWATDTAGLLSDETVKALDARLQAYQERTGRHVILWVGTSTGDVPLEEWAVRTFEAWGIGNARDEGVAIFAFAGDRTLRIEVGYGLESVLPDVIASRIIREEALPRLAAGEPDAAIRATVGGVLDALGGEAPALSTAPEARGEGWRPLPSHWATFLFLSAVFGLIGGVLLVFRGRIGADDLVLRSRAKARSLFDTVAFELEFDPNDPEHLKRRQREARDRRRARSGGGDHSRIGSSGGGSSGGGGGSSYSGGGGRSGGGGASGSW